MSDTSQGPDWWIASDDKWYPPDLHPSYRPPPPKTPTLRQGSGNALVDRIRWVNVARVVAVILVVIGIWLLFDQPSVTYRGYITPDLGNQAGTVSGQCISPWDRWTHHYGSTPLSNETFVQYNQIAGGRACANAISSREHAVWTLEIIGGLLFGGSLMVGRHKNSQRGELADWRPDPHLL